MFYCVSNVSILTWTRFRYAYCKLCCAFPNAVYVLVGIWWLLMQVLILIWSMVSHLNIGRFGDFKLELVIRQLWHYFPPVPRHCGMLAASVFSIIQIFTKCFRLGFNSPLDSLQGILTLLGSLLLSHNLLYYYFQWHFLGQEVITLWTQFVIVADNKCVVSARSVAVTVESSLLTEASTILMTLEQCCDQNLWPDSILTNCASLMELLQYADDRVCWRFAHIVRAIKSLFNSSSLVNLEVISRNYDALADCLATYAHRSPSWSVFHRGLNLPRCLLDTTRVWTCSL